MATTRSLLYANTQVSVLAKDQIGHVVGISHMPVDGQFYSQKSQSLTTTFFAFGKHVFSECICVCQQERCDIFTHEILSVRWKIQ